MAVSSADRDWFAISTSPIGSRPFSNRQSQTELQPGRRQQRPPGPAQPSEHPGQRQSPSSGLHESSEATQRALSQHGICFCPSFNQTLGSACALSFSAQLRNFCLLSINLDSLSTHLCPKGSSPPTFRARTTNLRIPGVPRPCPRNGLSGQKT